MDERLPINLWTPHRDKTSGRTDGCFGCGHGLEPASASFGREIPVRCLVSPSLSTPHPHGFEFKGYVNWWTPRLRSAQGARTQPRSPATGAGETARPKATHRRPPQEPNGSSPDTSLPPTEGRARHRMRKSLQGSLGRVVFEAEALEKGVTARREATCFRYMPYPRGLKKKKQGESGRHSGHSPVAGACHPETAPSEASGGGWRAARLMAPSMLGGVVPAPPEDSG